VIFAVNTNGSGFTELFGTTVDGGINYGGTIFTGGTLFKISTGGAGFTEFSDVRNLPAAR
jgi:hypothetical protein